MGLFGRKRSIDDLQLLKGATDGHSHILFGVDDGIAKAEESLAVLDMLEKQGLRELWLTPHTMVDVPNTTEGLRARFEELKSMYNGSIELHLASEYMMDENFFKHLDNRDFLTHKENNSVLMETSCWNAPYRFWETMDETMRAGYRPVLAHPERYEYMSMKDYKRLNEMGVRLQLNYPSLLGIYGKNVAKRAATMLHKGLYSLSGSDCHRQGALRWQLEAKDLDRKTADELHKLLTR